MAKLPQLSQDELACIYSALILADDDITVTSEKLTTILRAAEIEVEPIWPTLYSRALQGVDIRRLLASNLSGGTAEGQGVAGGTATGEQTSSQVGEEKAPDKEPEPEEDSEDEDMGLSLFD